MMKAKLMKKLNEKKSIFIKNQTTKSAELTLFESHTNRSNHNKDIAYFSSNYLIGRNFVGGKFRHLIKILSFFTDEYFLPTKFFINKVLK